MKLRNKKTGEIEDFIEIINIDNRLFARVGTTIGSVYKKEVHSLAELNEEWEDYEEPVGYWYISEEGIPGRINFSWDSKECIENHKEIGNYFETYEEAEKAVEKLKAWKRLRDNGFKFNGDLEFDLDNEYKELKKDLDLLFGGDE